MWNKSLQSSDFLWSSCAGYEHQLLQVLCRASIPACKRDTCTHTHTYTDTQNTSFLTNTHPSSGALSALSASASFKRIQAPFWLVTSTWRTSQPSLSANNSSSMKSSWQYWQLSNAQDYVRHCAAGVSTLKEIKWKVRRSLCLRLRPSQTQDYSAT